MGGQVLGGGVIVLVAVALWLVYLLPSWHSRYQYDAAERNAVRLNQALRILAETSETPEEVRLELNARTALAQQKLARRAQAEREQAEIARARVESDLVRRQARTQAEIARSQADIARAEADVARERARAEAAALRESVAAEAAAARALPAARRARARRRARLLVTVVGLIAVGLAVWGGVQVVLTGSQVLLWSSVAGVVVAGLMLQRMARVGARASVRVTGAMPARVTATLQDLAVGAEARLWTPRELPRPLVSSSGSRAAAVLDAAAAREALRHAALEESMRERAELVAPPSIEVARAARVASAAAPAAPEFARMGYVDDAEIEAHVRQLLERRASGQ